MQSTTRIVSRLCFTLVLSAAAAGTARAQSAAAQPAAPSAPSPEAPSPTLAPSAQADDGRAMVRMAFGRADANKDGKLTPVEASTLPPVAAKFDQLDANKDGVISEDEFIAGVRIGG